MSIQGLMIANRGEIAIRIARAAADLGIRSVAVAPEDDANSLHLRVADEHALLPGRGVPAYLDIAALIEAAREANCDAVHPGYGFLAESAAFARACGEAGIAFVGPTPHLLDLFGDKVRAREAAAEAGVPVLAGSSEPATLEEAREFFAALPAGGALMIKAVAGGGGRGTRIVREADELEAAWERCASEARTAFGNDALYLEQFAANARHIEVQVVGDQHGAVTHLRERECSIQRRHQKIIEIAPAPHLDDGLRSEILDAALRLARDVGYSSLGTIEFLVDGAAGEFWFLEANARLQVEHTVTEQVTGVDLVQSQLRIAQGETLADLGLAQAADPGNGVRPRGYAVQTRGAYRDAVSGRERAADGRGADGLRAAERAGGADGRVRLRRLRDESVVRPAAGEGDRALAVGEVRRRADAGLAGAERVPDRGLADEHPVPAERAGASGCRAGRHPHALAGREHPVAGRERGGTAGAVRLVGGGGGRGGSGAGGGAGGQQRFRWRCSRTIRR